MALLWAGLGCLPDEAGPDLGSRSFAGRETTPPRGAGAADLRDGRLPEGRLREGRLRVATYNIAGGRMGLPQVVSTLRAMDVDLVGLQEVWRHPRQGLAGDQAAVIARGLAMPHRAWGAHRITKVPEEGLALVSRFPLSDIAVVPTPPGRRVLLRAQAHTPRGRITLLVVHLRAVGLSVGARRARYIAQRRAEAALAAREAQAAAGSGGLVLLLGDLNDGPGSETLKSLAPLLADACLGKAGKTWPSGLPVLRLDHILFGPGLKSLGCRAVPSTASDHRPLVAELTW